MLTTPTTTRADRKGRLVRVALVVDYLRGGWRSGQEIMSHVEIESERIGQRTGYNNVQGATRNARLRALLGGLCWQYMDVDAEMTGAGTAFRLWTITEEAVPRPHIAWQEGGAVVAMLTGDPRNPTVRRYGRPDLSGAKERTSAEVERLRSGAEIERKCLPDQRREGGGAGGPRVAAAIRAGKRKESIPPRPAPTFHDGRRLGPEPEPEAEAGEQGRLRL